MAGGTIYGKQIEDFTIDWNKILFDPLTVHRAVDNEDALQKDYTPGTLYVKPDLTIAFVEGTPDIPEPTEFSYIVGRLSAGPLPGAQFDYLSVLNQETRTGALGENVSATFNNFGEPVVYFYAEPITEPLKTRWFVDELNQELIGSQQDRSSAWLLAEGQWFIQLETPVRVYFTTFATEFTTVQFRTL